MQKNWLKFIPILLKALTLNLFLQWLMANYFSIAKLNWLTEKKLLAHHVTQQILLIQANTLLQVKQFAHFHQWLTLNASATLTKLKVNSLNIATTYWVKIARQLTKLTTLLIC